MEVDKDEPTAKKDPGKNGKQTPAVGENSKGGKQEPSKTKKWLLILIPYMIECGCMKAGYVEKRVTVGCSAVANGYSVVDVWCCSAAPYSWL